MQLPQDLQHFSVPTLIVVGDSVGAKFFLAGGDAVEEVDAVSLPRETSSDSEGSFNNVDTGRSNAPEPKDEEERLHRLVHVYQEKIEELIRHHDAAEVCLVMNAELAHGVTHHLPGDVLPKITRELHHDMAKSGLEEIIRKLLQDTPPFLPKNP
jgi:hypothetical protein